MKLHELSHSSLNSIQSLNTNRNSNKNAFQHYYSSTNLSAATEALSQILHSLKQSQQDLTIYVPSESIRNPNLPTGENPTVFEPITDPVPPSPGFFPGKPNLPTGEHPIIEPITDPVPPSPGFFPGKPNLPTGEHPTIEPITDPVPPSPGLFPGKPPMENPLNDVPVCEMPYNPPPRLSTNW